MPPARGAWFHRDVPGTRPLLKYWLPVALWMLLIFSASTGLGSAQRPSRILGPLLRWLVPGIAEETIGAARFGVRKTGHVLEFAVLAGLLWRARRQPILCDPRPWSWAEARWALLVAALYAATDEFHQSFVPSRDAAVADVLLDTAGAALGLLCLWRVGLRLKRW